jgi:DNA replication protein DnaC
MSTETVAAVLEGLDLPGQIPEDGWIRCQQCGEEWRLDPGDLTCPPCMEALEERKRREIHRRWCQEHRVELLTRAEVPQRFHAPITFTRWPRDPRRSGADLSTWNGTPWAITLFGGAGVGKTTLAVELAWRWLAQAPEHETALFRRGTALLREALAGSPMVERARRCGLLILDDFGHGLANRTAWAMLGDILAERHAWERPTLLTTQLKHPALEKGHSPTADRLLDGLLCQLGGRSRRGL